eukprot:scaffold16122_cov557-Ochromonas_danica.AAC.1
MRLSHKLLMCLVGESSKHLSDSGGEALFRLDLGNNNNHKKDEGLTLVNSKVWSPTQLISWNVPAASRSSPS